MLQATSCLRELLEKTAVVPSWRKDFRRAFQAAADKTLVWHGVGGDNVDALKGILEQGAVDSYKRPNWFSKTPFNPNYFEHLGGVAVPETRLSNVVKMFNSPRAGGSGYRISPHPVPIQPKDLVVLPETMTATIENLLRNKHLRRLSSNVGVAVNAVLKGAVPISLGDQISRTLSKNLFLK